jgi:sec-independent protein translocase protein TatC
MPEDLEEIKQIGHDTNDKMPFTSHLSELRMRILIILSVVLICFSVAFSFSENLFDILVIPLKKDIVFQLTKPFFHFVDKPSAIISLVFLEPAEAFWMHIKVSMIAGAIVSIPIILMQIWLFIAPGLKQTERKYILPFIIAGTGLFLVGATFCFMIILPFAMGFLLTYKTASLTPMLSVGAYMDFVLKFILAFGAIFELPIVMVVLAAMGIISPNKLAKSRKYAFVIAFIVAAFLTPTPDAFNQTLMAVPIILLYEIGILASRIFYKEKKAI